MKFYNVENLQVKDEILSSGIDTTVMSIVFKIIDKKSEFKELGQIIDFNIVLAKKGYEFHESDGVIFTHQDKKNNFSIVKENTLFEIKSENTTYYCAIHEGKFKSNIDKNMMINTINHQSILSSDPIELKAINWLNNGNVGLSSGTMCATLFPSLKSHHKLNEMRDWEGNFEINIPHDNSDFKRCLKFLEAVPEAKERLIELKKLSSQWEQLVNNWEDIENLIKESKNEEAYGLIKKCIRESNKMRI